MVSVFFGSPCNMSTRAVYRRQLEFVGLVDFKKVSLASVI